jgi:hypothetical protein
MRYVDANELSRFKPESEAAALPTKPTKPTLAYAEAEGCIIIAHTADPPGDAEWAAWLEALGRYLERTPAPRMLIVSRGGAPSPTQRRAADTVSSPHYRNMKVAIISGSTFVRGVVAAFRMVLPFYRAYSPTELGAALDYLDVPRDRARQLESRLVTLTGQGAT